MVNVAFIGFEDPVAGNEPAYCGKDDIKDGHTESKEGDEETTQAHFTLCAVLDREAGQCISKKIAAAVTHKDPGGIEIVAQEAERCSGNGGEGYSAFFVARNNHENGHYRGTKNNHPGS